MTAILFFAGILSTIAGLPLEHRSLTNGTELEATVEEVPRPSMTVAKSDYRLPGFYTFNNGEPFFVEKDPKTGAIDFNLKTTPTGPATAKSPDSKQDRVEVAGDYVYDDENTQEFAGEEIDRKDGHIDSEGYRPNEIQNKFKIPGDLHAFLNLPVHYSSNDKFPLISSSYSNTKIQGAGSGSYSNHKPYSTSPTLSPSYYTMRTSSTTPKTKTTTKPTTTIKPSDYPSVEGEDLAYSDYDYEPIQPVNETPVPPTRAPTSPTLTSSLPLSKSPTTTTPKTVATSESLLSIVTSMPINSHYLSQETSSTTTSTPTSTKFSEKPAQTTMSRVASQKITPVTLPALPTIVYGSGNEDGTQHLKSPGDTIYGINEFRPIVDEPFRPIIGPEKQGQSELINHSRPQAGNNDVKSPLEIPDKSNIIGTWHEAPPPTNPATSSSGQIKFVPRPTIDQSISYSQRPTGSPTKYSGNELPSRPGSYLPTQFAPPRQQVTQPVTDFDSQYKERPKPNYPKNPQGTDGPVPESHFNVSGKIEQNHSVRPIETIPPGYTRPLKTETLIGEKRPEGVIFPQQRPKPGVPTFIDMIPPKLGPATIHQSTNSNSQFIKVSPERENPSYALQTSFSIGVPPDHGGTEINRPGQGVGQVLFPDEEPLQSTQYPHYSSLPNNELPLAPRPQNPPRPLHHHSGSFPGLIQSPRPGPRPQNHPHRPPLRVPPRPPIENYPRPHWESYSKPYYNQPGNTLPKKEAPSPVGYSPIKRVKPSTSQRQDLPNILPQFRPNAKIGHDYHSYASGFREPLDTLQPPPLPQPQYLRINRNDDESEGELIEEKSSTQAALVHRRTGPQASSKVTTLQMIQNVPPKKAVLHNDYQNIRETYLGQQQKDKPVFVVYPSNAGMNASPSEEVVVIGTRGSHQPVPPANLGTNDEDLDDFPLDDNKPFLRDRGDTPILKTKPTSKPVIKNDFPYPLIKPEKGEAEERIITSGSVPTKAYNAFSPTVSSSTEDIKDHDTEINLIPYLQDYMPFATKKPIPNKPTITSWPNKKVEDKVSPTNNPISATLMTVNTTKPEMNQLDRKSTTPPSQQESFIKDSSGGSEFTVGAVMHTQFPQKPASNHRPIIEIPISPLSSSSPMPQDFQAPFQASLSAPSQGWSVVGSGNSEKNKANERTESDTDKITAQASADDSKFDFENFKPQLFGGFKPILPPNKEDKTKVDPVNRGGLTSLERQERKQK